MAQKIINEDTLRNIVKECIKKAINEDPALALNYYEEPQTNTDLITEMARINTDESNLFPHNSYKIQIWSNDHTPPHFHVLKEGWDVAFLIETGELYKLNKTGENRQIYNYMTANIGRWLSAKCAVLPMVTNRQNANAVWRQLHSEK